MNKTNKTVEGHNGKNQMKTFNIYHVERNDGNYDEYYKGKIEAKDIDEAIEIVKKEYIKEEDLLGVEDYSNEPTEALLFIHTDYFDEDGNQITAPDDFDESKHNYLEHDIVIREIDEKDIIDLTNEGE